MLRLRVLASLVVGVLLSGLTSVVLSSPASATFPGSNGLVAFIRAGDLYTVAPSSGQVERLTTSGGISAPTWSPQGTAIAYKKRANLVVRTVATGQVTRVATGVASGPAWSPDGGEIAFVAPLPEAECGEQAVYAVPATGGAEPRLVFNPFSDNCPHGTDVFGLGTYASGGQGLLLTTCYRYRDDLCGINEVSTDPANRTVRHVESISCNEEDTPLDYQHPGTCDFGLHLSAAKVGPGGNGVLFSGKGGNPPLPGTSSFPNGTLEKVYVIDKSGIGPAPRQHGLQRARPHVVAQRHVRAVHPEVRRARATSCG